MNDHGVDHAAVLHHCHILGEVLDDLMRQVAALQQSQRQILSEPQVTRGFAQRIERVLLNEFS